MSTVGDILSTVGGVQYCWDIMSTVGVILSTVGDIMMHVGDIMSTVGGVQYSTIFFSWTTLGILLKFALCHFDDYDDYLEHFQLLTSI